MDHVCTQAIGISVFLKLYRQMIILSVFKIVGLPSVLSFSPVGGGEPV